MKRPYFLFYINKIMYGVKMPRLGTEDALMSLHPLPPLAEQKRIVDKIDRLMAGCDELEQKRSLRDQKRITVHRAAINCLLNSPEDDGRAWQFIAQNFKKLYSTKENITELRKAILQLAVMGKLVPQDPNDEPASELLKAIEAEKERSIQDGKIKKSKPLPEIKPEEMPYDLPKSWEWIRLGDIVSVLGDGLHGTPIYDETGDYYFVNGNNLCDGVIIIKDNTKKVSFSEYLKYKKDLNEKTVFVSINGTIGNVGFYKFENIILGKSVCYFNLIGGINKHYIKKLINSSYFLLYALFSATGSTIKNVSLKVMREFAVPLPPLAEQKRIVEKIDRLMALCDQLEQHLEAATHQQTRLLQAVMAQV